MRGILAVVLATWSFGAATWSLGAQARPTLVLTCDASSPECVIPEGSPGQVLHWGDDQTWHWVNAPAVPQAQAAFDMTAMPPLPPDLCLQRLPAVDYSSWAHCVPFTKADGTERRVLACPIDASGQWSADLGVCWWEEMPK